MQKRAGERRGGKLERRHDSGVSDSSLSITWRWDGIPHTEMLLPPRRSQRMS
jgi:hypothetical protein